MSKHILVTGSSGMIGTVFTPERTLAIRPIKLEYQRCVTTISGLKFLITKTIFFHDEMSLKFLKVIHSIFSFPKFNSDIKLLLNSFFKVMSFTLHPFLSISFMSSTATRSAPPTPKLFIIIRIFFLTTAWLKTIKAIISHGPEFLFERNYPIEGRTLSQDKFFLIPSSSETFGA